MIMNFNLKLFKSTLCILSVLIASFAHAETIELLQKNASVAYEKMMEAEREAETAKRKSEQAKIAMEQAINRWKQASDTLANEWGKSEVK